MQEPIRQIALRGLERIREDHLARKLRTSEETMESLDSLAASSHNTGTQDLLRLSRSLVSFQTTVEGKIAVYEGTFSALAQGSVGGMASQASLALQVYGLLRDLSSGGSSQLTGGSMEPARGSSDPKNASVDPGATAKKAIEEMRASPHLLPEEQAWARMVSSLVRMLEESGDQGKALEKSLEFLSGNPKWDSSALSLYGVEIAPLLSSDDSREEAAQTIFEELEKMAASKEKDLLPYLSMVRKAYAMMPLQGGVSPGSATSPLLPGAAPASAASSGSFSRGGTDAAAGSPPGATLHMAVLQWLQSRSTQAGGRPGELSSRLPGSLDSLLSFVLHIAPTLQVGGDRGSGAGGGRSPDGGGGSTDLGGVCRIFLDAIERKAREEQNQRAVQLASLMNQLNALPLKDESEKVDLLRNGASLLSLRSTASAQPSSSLQTLCEFSCELMAARNGDPASGVAIGKFLFQEIEKMARQIVARGTSQGQLLPLQATNVLSKVPTIRDLEKTGSYTDETRAAIYTEGMAFLASDRSLDSTSFALLSGGILKRVGATADGVRLSSELLPQLMAQIAREGDPAPLPLLNFLVRASRVKLSRLENIPLVVGEGIRSLADPPTVKGVASMGISLMKILPSKDQAPLADLLMGCLEEVGKKEGGKPLEEWLRLLRETLRCASRAEYSYLEVASLGLKAAAEGVPQTPSQAAKVAASLIKGTGIHLERLKMGKLLAGYLASLPEDGPEGERVRMARVLARVSGIDPYGPSTLGDVLAKGFSAIENPSASGVSSLPGFVNCLTRDISWNYADKTSVAEASLPVLKEVAMAQGDHSTAEFLRFLEKAGRIPPPEEQDRASLYALGFRILDSSPAAPVLQRYLQIGTSFSPFSTGSRGYKAQFGELLLDEVARVAPQSGDPILGEQVNLIRTLAALRFKEPDDTCKVIHAALTFLKNSGGKPSGGDPYLPLVSEMVKGVSATRDEASLALTALDYLSQKARDEGDQAILVSPTQGARDEGDQDRLAVFNFQKEILSLDFYGEFEKSGVVRAISSSFAEGQKYGTLSYLADLSVAVIQGARSPEMQLKIGELGLKLLEGKGERDGDNDVLPYVLRKIRGSVAAEPDEEKRVRALVEGLNELADMEKSPFKKALLKEGMGKKGEEKTVDVREEEVVVGDTTIPVNSRSWPLSSGSPKESR